ncbi:MAG: DsrH/TusB family sulfur metabolism protein [Candidatus Hodarchaeales archaeon]
MIENLVLYGYSGYDEYQRKNLASIALKLQNAGIVLLEDAVIGSLKVGSEHPYAGFVEEKIPLYCVVEDLEARGMNSSLLEDGIKPITFSELIDLIEESQRLISWL